MICRAIAIGAIVAASGCGKTGGRADATDAAAAARAEASAEQMNDEREMAAIARIGVELPHDGGPVVLYGTKECTRGSKHGPCSNENCGHKLCGESRMLAVKKCSLCGQPLGFGVLIACIADDGELENAALPTPSEIGFDPAVVSHVLDSDSRPRIRATPEQIAKSIAVHYDCWRRKDEGNEE